MRSFGIQTELWDLVLPSWCGNVIPQVYLDGMICYSQILAERAVNVSMSECTVSKLDLHFNVEKLGVSQACCKILLWFLFLTWHWRVEVHIRYFMLNK